MASGKSLELAAIGVGPAPWKCLCGVAYSDHLRKDRKGVLKKYEDTSKHRPLTGIGMNRAQRRKAKHG